MITILVNGKQHEIQSGAMVSELIAQLDLTGKRIAVEMNGEIVPKGLHAQTELTEGAELEIVVAVGGG